MGGVGGVIAKRKKQIITLENEHNNQDNLPDHLRSKFGGFDYDDMVRKNNELAAAQLKVQMQEADRDARRKALEDKKLAMEGKKKYQAA